MLKEKLIRDVENALDKWDEYNLIKIKGVKLSRSDIDTLILYAETEGHGLMKPRLEVAEALSKYGYVHPTF